MKHSLSLMMIWCCLIVCSVSLAQESSDSEPNQLDAALAPVELSAERTGELSGDKADDQAGEVGAPVDPLLAKQYQRAVMIDVNGPIFGPMRAYINNRISRAENEKADLILVRVTSPGGDLDDSEAIARLLSKIDWATTIVFIPDAAYSGAAILSLGADRIFMEPRALIGDAGPMILDKGAFRFVEPKLISKIAAEVRQIAESNGRSGALAEAMVDHKLVVYEATNKQTGKREYVTAHQIAQPNIAALYDIGDAVPETGQERFLTVSGTRAVELGLAEATFDSERLLLERLKIAQLTTTKRTWVDNTVYYLNRPLVTGLLLLIGLIGLYMELTVPGISVAGLLSFFCFGIFFWSHALGGTSGWLEVMLFIIGVGALTIEIFVLPGLGIFGFTGVGLIVLSLVMASQDFILPQTTLQWETLGKNLLIVLGTLAIVGVAFIVQIMLFDWIPGLGRLRLQTPEQVGAVNAPEMIAGSSWIYQPELGVRGQADSVLRPAGKVRFDNHIVDVVTEGDFLDAGTEVEVIRREGNRIVVRRV